VAAANGVEPLVPRMLWICPLSITGHPGWMSARRAKSGTTLVGEVVTAFRCQGRADPH
jgi:hypothetical protein